MDLATAGALGCATAATVVLLGRPSPKARLAAIVAERALAEAASGSRSVRPGGQSAGATPAVSRASARRRLLAALLAAIAGLLLVEGSTGVGVAIALGVGSWVGLGRLPSRSEVLDRQRIVAMLPLAADLLVEALAAGCPPGPAIKATGHAIGGPLGRALLEASAASAVGADPVRAWSELSAEPAARPLVRALIAATTRGAAPGPVLQRVARDARDTARWAGEARARSLGARAAAPLGLCFLPAFVLLGVVPIVATAGWGVP